MRDRLFRRLQQKRAMNDKGLTLVELLVVITILGVLAAIVIVAVSGIGDKGKAAAADTEVEILRTAQAVYCADNDRYGTIQQLKNDGVVERDPGFYGTVPFVLTDEDPNTACNGTDYYVGPNTVYNGGDTSDPLFYSASNNTFPQSFLAPQFIQATDANGKPVNGAFRIEFGASGALKNDANNPAVADVASLLTSADTVNALALVPTGTPTPGGNGTCLTGPTATCRGIAATVTRYTIGQLVMFSCRSGGDSLPPSDGGKERCKKPPALTGGTSEYLASPPTTLTGIVARITSDPLFKVAIPSAGTAPYGIAAEAALTSAGLTLPHPQVVSSGNVTGTQNAVIDGTAHMALIPKSFVISPGGADTHNWTDVPTSSHPAIEQWGVVLETDATPGLSSPEEQLAKRFLDFLTSQFGQQVLVYGYGYAPVTAIPTL